MMHMRANLAEARTSPLEKRCFVSPKRFFQRGDP